MKSELFKAESRGHANHVWLDTYHTFSFAGYYDPERMSFGVLRVLNDDVVSGGQGFGTHRHDNMEIISIPLEGDLEHKDSMGNVAVIRKGDVQIMSAGSGVSHSEYNFNPDSDVNFLQIWIIPNKQQVEPRYDQISIADIAVQNQLYQILSPNNDDQGVWIHQDAWFSMGNFDKSVNSKYVLNKEGNGVFVFILEGECSVGDQILTKRDGLGIWEAKDIELQPKEGCTLLLMEVPMQLN